MGRLRRVWLHWSGEINTRLRNGGQVKILIEFSSDSLERMRQHEPRLMLCLGRRHAKVTQSTCRHVHPAATPFHFFYPYIEGLLPCVLLQDCRTSFAA